MFNKQILHVFCRMCKQQGPQYKVDSTDPDACELNMPTTLLAETPIIAHINSPTMCESLSVILHSFSFISTQHKVSIENQITDVKF